MASDVKPTFHAGDYPPDPQFQYFTNFRMDQKLQIFLHPPNPDSGP